MIAIRGECFRAVQVKTRTDEPFALGPLPAHYHVLALEHSSGEGDVIYLDQSRVYLVPKAVVEPRTIRTFGDVEDFALRRELVETLFS